MENKPKTLGVRPPVLSILCVAGLFGSFINMIMVITPSIQAYGRWYAAYLSLSTVVLIICLSGLWLMKRWGLFVLIPCVLLDQWVYWVLDRWAPAAIILKGAILIVGLVYFRRLKR